MNLATNFEVLEDLQKNLIKMSSCIQEHLLFFSFTIYFQSKSACRKIINNWVLICLTKTCIFLLYQKSNIFFKGIAKNR